MVRSRWSNEGIQPTPILTFPSLRTTTTLPTLVTQPRQNFCASIESYVGLIVREHREGSDACGTVSGIAGVKIETSAGNVEAATLGGCLSPPEDDAPDAEPEQPGQGHGGAVNDKVDTAEAGAPASAA